MKDWELHILFFSGMAWQILGVYLVTDLNPSFGFTNWLLSSWTFHYFLGFYLKKIVTAKNTVRFYLAALAGLVITVLGCYFFKEDYQTPYSLAPAHILLVMGTFVFLTKEILIEKGWMKKIILTLSSHSFMIYIIHHIVKKEIEKVIQNGSPALLQYCLHFFLTFCISFLLSFLLNKLLFFPLQRKIQSLTWKTYDIRDNR